MEIPIKTIPNDHKITKIIYKPMFSAICSIGLAPFSGTLEIIYLPGDRLLEFESFEEQLKEISLESNTIEGFTRVIFDRLTSLLGEIPMRVSTIARTQVHAPVISIIERGEIK